jgi:hypothetical protein
MPTSVWRVAGWAAFLVLAVVRPGVNAIERRLVEACWDIPSEWNAVADIAIKNGAVDSNIGGDPAPWRQASVVELAQRRIAVVTVSDMRRSRATFLSRDYQALGTFERTTSDPALVTDETRGYKPLTHIWPVIEREHRLETLIAFAPLKSDPPNMGVFAYLAVGPDETEILFVCRLRWGPGPSYVLLDRADANSDGIADLVLYENGRRDAAPVGKFLWDSARGEYKASVSGAALTLASWWSTSPTGRVTIRSGRSVDAAVEPIVAAFPDVDRPATSAR